ncbi:hypothetical protein HHL11_08270 [Ramlibacter sp. G-1-2-2]|uniref:Uncharacterized protein n=1 Tax=Ramlibacter agri TaxID=2728837 RepID=A0A848H2D9_9BURK|nr:hypothetical protein [Ramlibacter agri]
MVLVSCGGGGGGGAGETISVPTQAPLQTLQNARYVVRLVDSVTGQTISDSIKVTFVGAATLKAADSSGLNGKTITTSDGLVFVDAAFTAGAQDFSIQLADAGAKGWVATGTRIVGVAGLKGDQAVEIKMVNTNQAAAVNASDLPVAMAVAPGSATASGAFAAPVVLATASKAVTNAEGNAETIGTSSLAIPAGTVGRTAGGAAAAPGPLTVSNTYFGNANSDSLRAFPGGFAATVDVPAANAAVLNGSAADQGSFITAGFAQFNVTDSKGNAIKKFDQPLTVGIDLPKSTLDENGHPLTVGSQYPVWSYDDTNGKWVFEKMGTVAEKTPVDADNFTVQFQTQHLSSWNLDQYVNSCTASVNITGRPAADDRPLEIVLVGATGQRYGNITRATDSSLTLLRAPNIAATLTALDRGKVVGKVSVSSLCGGPVALPVTLAPIVGGTLKVESYEYCSDNSSHRRELPTLVSVSYAPNAAGVFTAWTSFYADQPSSTTTAAQGSIAGFPAGPVEVSVQNPRTGEWMVVIDGLSGDKGYVNEVGAGSPTVFTARFPMNCKSVTGGGGF